MSEENEPVRHQVTMLIEVDFEGVYFEGRELPGMVKYWIDSGFEDRNNLVGWQVVMSEVRRKIDPD